MAAPTKLTVNWTAPSDTGGAPITNYKVTVTKTGGAAPATKEVGTVLTADLTVSELNTAFGSGNELKPGDKVSITVAAKNSAGYGTASTAVDSDPFPANVPGAPTGVSGTWS